MKYNSLRIFTTVLSVLACLAFSPHINAAPEVAPPPDGCYPGFTTAEGCQALQSLTTGSGNTGVGWRSLFAVGAGSFNTGVGAGALVLNTNDNNTAVGAVALLLNTTGSDNTAVGTAALENSNVDGNTATGAFALFANTTGGTLETVGVFDLGPNTAVGSHALEMNVDGSANTAVGYNALHSQVHGLVAEGAPQLAANTAVGFEALANVTGSAAGNNVANTALGYQALSDLTDGNSNIAIGFQAGAPRAPGISLTSGNRNIFIGTFQGPVLAAESDHTYIGNIRGTSQPIAGSVEAVTINTSTGLLGHNSSSRRYKEDIKPMDKVSEALYRLKPVTYRVKKEINSAQPTAFGLIAEEVADVNPALIVRNAQGQVEGVHYEMVNAMLLNEFLKEHKKVEELQATVAQQQKGMEVLTAQLKEQAAQIQKVSAQLEVNTTAPRTVANK